MAMEPSGQDAAPASPSLLRSPGPSEGRPRAEELRSPPRGALTGAPRRSTSTHLTPNPLRQSLCPCGCDSHRPVQKPGVYVPGAADVGGGLLQEQLRHRAEPQRPPGTLVQGPQHGRRVRGPGLGQTQSGGSHPGQLGQQRVHLLVAGGDGLSDVGVVPAGGGRWGSSEVVGTAAAGAQTPLTARPSLHTLGLTPPPTFPPSVCTGGCHGRTAAC